MVLTVVVSALVCAGAVIDTFVKVLAVGIRVGVAIGLSINPLTGTMLDVLARMGVDVLAGVNVNIFAGVTTAFEFDVRCPLERFPCCAAFDCRPTPSLDCDTDLHTWMPSYHVCSSLALPALPHFPNQEPLRAQQLIFPDFAMIPHLGHAELIVVVVAVCACGNW